MGIDVVLETEFGAAVETLSDARGKLSKLLGKLDNERNVLLNGIDPYGDTVFNRIQMSRFLSEWQVILANASAGEECELALGVERLAKRCADEVHCHIRFVGD